MINRTMLMSECRLKFLGFNKFAVSRNKVIIHSIILRDFYDELSFLLEDQTFWRGMQGHRNVV